MLRSSHGQRAVPLSGNIRRPFGSNWRKHDRELQTSRFFDRTDYGKDARAKVDTVPELVPRSRGESGAQAVSRPAALHDPPHAASLRAAA